MSMPTTKYGFSSKFNRVDFWKETGSAAIAMTVAPESAFGLIGIRIKLSAVPTTSESLTISIDDGDGAAYDNVIYTCNPATEKIQYIFFSPENLAKAEYELGDKIVVSYANTDTLTYGAKVIIGRFK